MSVIYVILCFILCCLVLVHINLHQRKNELYNLIFSATKTIITRHKKIKKILKHLDNNELAQEIKVLNEDIVSKLENNELTPSKVVKVEVILEDKMKTLLDSLKEDELSEELKEAINSYNITQKKVKKNKKKYNELITKFLEACNIKPANWYASLEKIDTNFDKLDPDDEK